MKLENKFKGNRVAEGQQVIATRVEDMRERVPVTSYKTLSGVEA